MAKVDRHTDINDWYVSISDTSLLELGLPLLRLTRACLELAVTARDRVMFER